MSEPCAAKATHCAPIGDQDGAIAAYRSSIEVRPLHAEAYWSLANLKTFRFEEREVEAMLALLDDDARSPRRDRCN